MRSAVARRKPSRCTLTCRPSSPAPRRQDGSVGTAFNYQITGTAAPSAFGAIGLPSWLSVDPVAGVITGTPPGGGVYTFTPTATNYAGTGSQQVVLTVTGGGSNTPSFSSASTASGTAGTPFTFTLAASNSPTSYSALLLPTGLTLDPNSGIISGTPTTAGTYSIPITATNGNGTTGGELTITLAAAVVPALSNPLTASCNAGNSFTYQIPASGLVGIYNATGLPQGLSVNVVSGLISGSPSLPGTTPISLTATNATGTATATLNLTVIDVPVSTSTWLNNYPTLTGGLYGAPQANGVANILKYFCHINPINSMATTDFTALPKAGHDTTTTPGTTYITITYRKWASATGVAITYESSTDMKTWSAVTPDMSVPMGTDTNTGDPIMVDYFNANGASKKFIRPQIGTQ